MFALPVNSGTTTKRPPEGGAVVRSEQSGRLVEMHILAVILIILASGGSSLAEPRSTYVPPSSYLEFDCPQLAQEAHALSSRSAKVAGLQQSDPIVHGNENNSTTIRWPKAFSLVGDSSIADKLALMRGQMIAIEEASVRRQCSIQFQRAPA
jgi:hypothetical protein